MKALHGFLVSIQAIRAARDDAFFGWPPPMPLLSLSHVSMRSGGQILLDDVTLAVERGEKTGHPGA